jgi:hypothetical protein
VLLAPEENERPAVLRQLFYQRLARFRRLVS